MNCSQCNTVLEPDARFCGVCGEAIVARSVEVSAAWADEQDVGAPQSVQATSVRNVPPNTGVAPLVPPESPVQAKSGMASQGTSFFGSLFDWNFEHFVSLKIVKVVYILLVALMSIASIGILLVSLSLGPLFLLALVIVPIVFLYFVAVNRIFLEFLIASIRTAQNTTQMAQQMSEQR